MICSGIDVSRWKVLGHRKQLPFIPRGDGTHRLRDAFLMRVMLRAMDGEAGSLRPSDAVRMVCNAAGYAANRYGPRPIDLVGHDAAIWFGAVEFAGLNTRSDEVERWVAWFAGPLAELPGFMAAQLANDTSRALRGAVPTRVVGLVNATQAAIEVITKAEELGVSE